MSVKKKRPRKRNKESFKISTKLSVFKRIKPKAILIKKAKVEIIIKYSVLSD